MDCLTYSFLDDGYQAISGFSDSNFSNFIGSIDLESERISKIIPFRDGMEVVGFKDSVRCRLELAMLADISGFVLASPNWGFLIKKQNSINFYVAEHQNNIRQLEIFEWANFVDDIPEKDKKIKFSKVMDYCGILSKKGYEINVKTGYNLFGVLDHRLIPDYFITNMNLDCFDNKSEIRKGFNGEGRLARLNEIYKNLPFCVLRD